jgi:hypothetical protein
MFTFPQVLLTPVLSSLGSGTVNLPTVGAVLAWLLVAALVGTGLAILREATRGARPRMGSGSVLGGTLREPKEVRDLDDPDREAA